MSLSRVELNGFKSFMNPVSLNFRGGITAVLGPNGCGKTNIVDAVRWVLGEQSARQLRSSKMENVIFNGTQVHKPMGCAVVSLTVNNERGAFPLDYSEITVTRKVYRSGISEYFINKTPCRLKDIRELFADTGTGSHSYAVIEQEMIDYVLNDVHGERRNMFEEAAGIVKYRMRREEAIRKLKLTEADLIRLDDILDELSKLVRSLRYQMGKAKRYRTIKERIRLWELIQLRRNLSALLEEGRTASSELARVQELTQQGDLSLGETERRVEEGKIRLLELERMHTEKQNRRYEIRRAIQVSEEEVIALSERRSEAGKRIERAGHEIEAARQRSAQISERISAVESNCRETSRTVAERREEASLLGEELKKLDGEMEKVRGELLEMKQTSLDFIQDQVRVESSLAHYESILSELDSRAAQLRERILELERETKGLAAQREEKEKELAAAEHRLRDVEHEHEKTTAEIGEVEQLLLEKDVLLTQKTEELARLQSRHDVLRTMRENLEGFPSGARHVLKKGDARVRGPLADLLKVEERYRPALEAVLAGMMDSVVVDKRTSAVDLVSELASEQRGRARFFVEHAEGGEYIARIADTQGCFGRLGSFVQTDEALQGMVNKLLGSTFVFEDTNDALEFIASRGNEPCAAVTLAGVYFDERGCVYYCGAAGEELSLLGQSEEIERMEETMGELDREVGALRGTSEANRQRMEALCMKVGDLWKQLPEIRQELSAHREELREIERAHITNREKCALLLKSLGEMEDSRGEILSKLEESRLTLEISRDGDEGAGVTELESRLASLQGRKAEIDAALTDKKVEIASLQGILDKYNGEIRGMREMQDQFQSLVKQREVEASSSREEQERLSINIEQQRGIVKELLEEESSFEKDIEKLAGEIEELRGDVSRMEQELKNKHAERERVFARENDLRVTLSKIETRAKELVDRAREIYGEDISYYLDGEEMPLSDEEKSVTPQMLEREKQRLDGLGPVNLAAVEEYEENKKRLDFLLSQKDDLARAKAELEEAIRKINKRARARFIEIFEVVSGYFSETFQVLFEGGEANLSLSDGSDPLEADIVITARPKGKRLQDISLLSGGERALTALALLFALYKAKPSPFCIFDEVDAPLDDSNIQRFVKMIKKFQDETQFIIITHNKRTMEVADVLYGVTMEEKGVSRVVSVDLADVERVMKRQEPAAEELVESPVSSN